MDFYGYFHGKLMERRIHKIRLLGPRIYKETPGQAAPVFGTGSKSMETIKIKKKKRGVSGFTRWRPLVLLGSPRALLSPISHS
jgi:hypothetical protein